MTSEQDETRRVIATFFLLASVQIPIFVIQIGTLIGLPYATITHWSEIQRYFCGAQCQGATKVILVIGALLAVSAITSGVFSLGILVSLTMKKKMDYVKEFVERMKASQDDP
jgi:hypothetical protein